MLTRQHFSLFKIKSSRKTCFISGLSLLLELLTAVITFSGIEELFPLPPLPHLPHSQRHHPHTASSFNLLPPPLIHPQPPGHRLAGITGTLQLSPPGVQLPPSERHLDQKANPLRVPPHPQAPAGCADKLAADPRASAPILRRTSGVASVGIRLRRQREDTFRPLCWHCG
jgi:hypothetical protein